jgi:hypothetical protein
MAGPLLLTEGCASKLVPAQTRSAPPLVHYNMPYASQVLTPGPVLDRAYDEALALSALQGIVNRSQPRLYVQGVPYADGTPNVDGFWWQRMGDLGWAVAKRTPYVATSFRELLQMFGHRTQGLAVWDPKVPATANVACTLAGVLDLLPVAYRPAPGGKVPAYDIITNAVPLYAQLRSAGWGVGAWLLNTDGTSLFTGTGTIPGTSLPSSGSAKNDAYLWAKAHYLDTGRCSAQYMAYYIDAYWLQDPKAGLAFWNNSLVNHDYYVSQRAFFFDLDPWPDESPVDDPHAKPGTDAATLDQILRTAYQRTAGKHMLDIGGFPPFQWKYSNYQPPHGPSAGGTHSPVATEWRYAETVSAYNAFMEADIFMANASFTQHFPLRPRYTQPGPPDLAKLKAAGWVQADGSVTTGRYFAFYVGDYDSPTWLWLMMPSFWLDPNRGKVPLAWAFDPNLSLRAGPAMEWTRMTATPNDSFIAGDSGAGYLNPGFLETPRPSGLPSGVATWAAHCKRFYDQWDIRVTGFIIEGNAPAMKTNGLKAYSEFSPGGIVGQELPAQAVVDGFPVMAMDTDLPSSATQAATTIRGLFSPVTDITQFSVARAVWQSPTWYKSVVDMINASNPTQGPIHIVDLPTLLVLVEMFQNEVAALEK